MPKPAPRLGILLLLLATMALGLIRQRSTTRQLRAELAAGQAQMMELATLRAQHRDLASRQISAEELERLHREHAEIESLRAKIAALKNQAPSAARKTSPDGVMISVGNWRFAGKETPQAAFESVLWAATHQDVDRLATLLSFDAKTRALAEEFFAQLPEAARDQYKTPEKVAATMLAASLPLNLNAMGQLAESTSPDHAMLIMGLQRSDGSAKDTAFEFQREADGWQLLVPAGVMAGYGQKLGVASVTDP